MADRFPGGEQGLAYSFGSLKGHHRSDVVGSGRPASPSYPTRPKRIGGCSSRYRPRRSVLTVQASDALNADYLYYSVVDFEPYKHDYGLTIAVREEDVPRGSVTN